MVGKRTSPSDGDRRGAEGDLTVLLYRQVPSPYSTAPHPFEREPLSATGEGNGIDAGLIGDRLAYREREARGPIRQATHRTRIWGELCRTVTRRALPSPVPSPSTGLPPSRCPADPRRRFRSANPGAYIYVSGLNSAPPLGRGSGRFHPVVEETGIWGQQSRRLAAMSRAVQQDRSAMTSCAKR